MTDDDPVAQQRDLLDRIAIGLRLTLPPDWTTVSLRCFALGHRLEAVAHTVHINRNVRPWRVPAGVLRLFDLLRDACAAPGHGSWFGVDYRMDDGGRSQLTFSRRQPLLYGLRRADYVQELHLFGWQGEAIPVWLRGGAGMPGGLRPVMLFDGVEFDGEPVIKREALEEPELISLLGYLTDAPSVAPDAPAIPTSTDLFADDRAQSVPPGFRTDGVWLWPEAVNYYLRHWRLPPADDFLAFIRAQEYRVPEVSSEALALAARQAGEFEPTA